MLITVAFNNQFVHHAGGDWDGVKEVGVSILRKSLTVHENLAQHPSNNISIILQYIYTYIYSFIFFIQLINDHGSTLACIALIQGEGGGVLFCHPAICSKLRY